ncbi:hypothetical protein D9599_30170 [Roseomonas sp. KE2513]|uniref:hypothetical protein n=1 Tax=Roseomonas sp. KE2513 TaxID=2479202 RepID=UPI0018E0085F|nr:hypothetical protein [Roseomonas sp. KE2513]MBI0539763.1 hypothetical protein [Roseomonas sp. KE2513]
MVDSNVRPNTPDRRASLLRAAEDAGLLNGSQYKVLAGRLPEPLVNAAMKRTGLTEPAQLLTYALVKLVMEDDFGERLLALKGSVPRGILTER